VVEIVGDTTYFQYATNISEGGVFLSRTLSHPPGTRVSLLFRVPGQPEPIALVAEVVGDAAEPGMRLRFLGLERQPALREKLRNLVGRYQPRS